MDITGRNKSKNSEAAAVLSLPKKRFFYNAKKYMPFYIMFLPVMIYYILFSFAPMFGVVLAFKEFNFSKGILGSDWVGFKYFAQFIGNGDFWVVMKNTLSISFLRILFCFPMPIILALLLHEVKNQRFKRFVQTSTYLPHFISWVVVYGFLTNIFSLDGVINQIGAMFGKEAIIFLGKQEYFRGLFVGSAVWKEIGWSAIIYLAALSGVDVQLYEAGMIDGVNRWQKLWYITLPSIRAIISVQFILTFGQILNVGFEQILVMYNPIVSQVAETLDYYIYRVGLLQANNFSYATAVGLFRSVVSLVFIVMISLLRTK